MPHGPGNITDEMRRCIESCAECHAVCIETLAHCIELGGDHVRPEQVRLLLDCAQICATSADFMSRGSDLHGYTCAACAAACERCASDCERFDDDFMKRCAEVCRRCAESCRRMAQMAQAA
jgi:hypothetical protein